jgi:methylated-DNA-[protein]-cysteine S-methyltransferase
MVAQERRSAQTDRAPGRHTAGMPLAVADDAVLTRVIAAPWGPIHIAASSRGMVAVEQVTTDYAFAAMLQARLHRPVLAALDAAAPDDDQRIAHLDAATRALDALFSGRRPAVDAPIDLSDRPGWDQAVLAAVRAIPWGTTASYGEIARRVGAAGAARAVGGAVGRNPVSLLVPCHRVIAADGTLGGYGGDGWGGRTAALERKRELLAREGVNVGSRAR